MTVIDIIFRVDSICKKYEKYDVVKQRELNAYGDDAFARLFAAKSEAASTETNRAAAVAMNAEVRRKKARLMDEVPKLRKLAHKKVKGVPKEELEVRDDLVLALEEKIKAIPDGKTSGAKHSGGWGSSSSFNNIKFDSSSGFHIFYFLFKLVKNEKRVCCLDLIVYDSSLDGNFESEYFQQSEESSQFRNEYEMRKMKQACLDVISEGLDMLKNLAHDMNEELDRQVPLIEEIDSKVDKVTDEIKNTNVRLKETLYEVRTSQNFCIDIILLCVILGIASYLYNILS
ncbi:syntaxin-71 isoform X2 [Cucumis melo var. makuwa]|uniref:Syntaxin-71 isoform X2 n=1 Tax=Cucumis melo var. makuwa TaxID=1194695 RepID=A0A5A7SVM6_CUCMM|nr:syntaxin-71 isoform X2 [Cucumis melo var. makuwa]